MYKRLYNFENLFNVRDLGEYKTENNHITKRHKYIRASAKGTLSDEEKLILYNDGVRIVIDLRHESEIKKLVNPLKDYKDIIYYHISMVGEFDDARKADMVDMSEMYLYLLTKAKKQIYGVFKLFIKHYDKTIFFNCTAGKDRTGIIAMLLLGLAKVSDSDIIDNYSESHKNNSRRPTYKNLPEAYKKYTYSEPVYMRKTLKFIEEKYKSIYDYLISIGLKAEELDLLNRSFVV